MAPTAEQGKTILDIENGKELLKGLPLLLEKKLYSSFEQADSLSGRNLNNHLRDIISAQENEFSPLPRFHDISGERGVVLFFEQLYITDLFSLAKYMGSDSNFLEVVINKGWGEILKRDHCSDEREKLVKLLEDRKCIFFTSEYDYILQDSELYFATQIVLDPKEPGYKALEHYMNISK